MQRQLLAYMACCLVLIVPAAGAASVTAGSVHCRPTPEDEMGPLYQPNAPVRNVVGSGYLLFGTVMSAIGCTPVTTATIEIWMAGPDGHYGDDWRATLFSAETGRYHFRSHVPPDYGTGKAHLHIMVTAEGFKTLVTQHYPRPGAGEALLDLVLVPE